MLTEPEQGPPLYDQLHQAISRARLLTEDLYAVMVETERLLTELRDLRKASQEDHGGG